VKGKGGEGREGGREGKNGGVVGRGGALDVGSAPLETSSGSAPGNYVTYLLRLRL